MPDLPVFRTRSAKALLIFGLLLSTAALATAEQTPSRLTSPINDQNVVTLKGNVHPQARAKNDRGQASGSLAMNRIVLVLKRSDVQEKALQSAIKAMHDPKSSQYHKWLTPAQFGKQYGASDADIAKVKGWLSGHGFQVDRVAQGRGTIEFSGTAESVGSTFHTQIHSYVVNGTQHYANATDPKIPVALTPVVSGVLSLHNFVKESKARILSQAPIDPTKNTNAAFSSKVASGKSSSNPNFTINGSNYVGPGDLWTIYNATPLITASGTRIDGTGQTIAIAGRSDVNSNDISGFRKTFLPAPYASTVPFTQINNGPDPGIVSGDDLEQTLDVEYSSAMAPGAQIDLVVSGSTNSTDGVDLSNEYIVDNNLAPVVSTSYGLCEALLGTGNSFYNALWQQAAAQGITAMVSTGDNGSAGCDMVGPSGSDSIGYVADEGLQVNGLASTPYNVAVGGNQFTNDTSAYWNASNSSVPAPHTSALSYVPEKVWNESCSPLVCGNAYAEIPAGSGGASGCFNYVLDANNNISSCTGGYAAPGWQAGVAGLPADNKRHIPDISLTAAGHDAYIVCFENSCASNGFYGVGGTSASSPAFAGIMALVNQQTGSRQGQANYTLYRLAGSQFGTVDTPNTGNLASCDASNGNAVGSSCIFHDVTSGTNAVPCDGGTLNCSSTTAGNYGVLTGYSAGVGYDSATGLGSVNVTNLVQHWNDTTLAATSTALTLGASTATFGSPVPLTVAVTPTADSGVPTGTVALLTDSTLADAIGAGVVTLTKGSFSGTISTLPGGTYNVSARYGGDGSYATSTSAGASITVAPASSAVSLTIVGSDPITGAAISGATLPYGSVVTGNATLSGVTGAVVPTGTVSFVSGKSKLTDVSSTPDGQASYVATGSGLGTYTWQASYAGNNNYNGSSSPVVSFAISQAATTLKLLSNSSYVVGSGTATVTAIVGADSLLLNPTGSVSLTLNGTSIGSAAVTAYTDASTGSSGAKATFSVAGSQLTAGANTLAASYIGDGNYLASASSPLTIGYGTTAPPNTISLVASPIAATTQQPVTLTATVTTGGIPSTAGTVEFFDGAVSLGTAQVAGSYAAKGVTLGTATIKLVLAPGSHSITATYRGILVAPTKVSSTAAAVTVTGLLPSATSLAAAVNADNSANYDLAATVTGFGLFAPTASVSFTETSVLDALGVATVDPATVAHTLLTPSLSTSGDSGARPAQSVVADFNGDGIPDMATPNASFSGGTMSVLIGNGDGTFKAPVTYAAGIFASAITTGDFNNDGIVDIAVTSQYNSAFGDGFVSIYLGNGDGTFQPQVVVNMPGYPVGTVVADFNRDGVLDIAALQYYPAQFSVAFGNGDGTFQAPVNYPVTAGIGSPYAISGGDFNGDGAADIVEANASDNTVGVFLNNGDGTFTASSYVSVTDPQWITVADINGDGKQDLLVSDYGDQRAEILLGNGDGSFQTAVPTLLSGYGNSFAVADIDGDGKPDLVAAYFYPAIGVGVLKGAGDGTFGAETVYATQQGHSTGVTLADLNGDGSADLIITDINGGDSSAKSISVLLNVTQAKAIVRNVAIAGPATTQEELLGVYSGDTQHGASSSASIFVSGSGVKSAPVILWTPASPWGTTVALGSSVLNASVSGNIAGTIAYTAQTGSGTAVRVTSASTLTAGTYAITATFVPVDSVSYSTATATRTVVIQMTDFTLENSTTSLTINAGSSSTLTVGIPALYGFNGTVALTQGNSLPGGFTLTASPSTIAAGGSSTITIQTKGLSSTTASSTQHESLGTWAAGGGIALGCMLIFPYSRRRKSLAASMLCMILVMSIFNGCGGAGFSNATVTLASSSTKAASGSAVTLTAKVASKNSRPSGSVTFYNGTTALGTAVAVSNGTASLPVSSLPVGLNSLTAVYTGDSHDSSATSSAVSQLITGQTSVEIVGTSGPVTHSTTVQITLQ